MSSVGTRCCAGRRGDRAAVGRARAMRRRASKAPRRASCDTMPCAPGAGGPRGARPPARSAACAACAAADRRRGAPRHPAARAPAESHEPRGWPRVRAPARAGGRRAPRHAPRRRCRVARAGNGRCARVYDAAGMGESTRVGRSASDDASCGVTRLSAPAAVSKVFRAGTQEPARAALRRTVSLHAVPAAVALGALRRRFEASSA
jgi:hypothetical protein